MEIHPTVDTLSAFVVERDGDRVIQVLHPTKDGEVSMILDKFEANMVGLWLIGIAQSMGD